MTPPSRPERSPRQPDPEQPPAKRGRRSAPKRAYPEPAETDSPGASTPSTAKKVLRGVSYVLVGALVGAGILLLWDTFQNRDWPKVNDCIIITEVESETADEYYLSHEIVDCDDEQTFSHHVVDILRGDTACPDGLDYLPLTKSTRSGELKIAKTACLVPNFQTGQCFTESDSPMGLELTSCAPGDITVASIVADGYAECDADEWALQFPEIAHTYCMAELEDD